MLGGVELSWVVRKVSNSGVDLFLCGVDIDDYAIWSDTSEDAAHMSWVMAAKVAQEHGGEVVETFTR